MSLLVFVFVPCLKVVRIQIGCGFFPECNHVFPDVRATVTENYHPVVFELGPCLKIDPENFFLKVPSTQIPSWLPEMGCGDVGM